MYTCSCVVCMTHLLPCIAKFFEELKFCMVNHINYFIFAYNFLKGKIKTTVFFAVYVIIIYRMSQFVGGELMLADWR